jgi:hypothetical protein
LKPAGHNRPIKKTFLTRTFILTFKSAGVDLGTKTQEIKRLQQEGRRFVSSWVIQEFDDFN